MKQITVLSGKGGTGKTILVASFAALTQGIVVSDCDVDAPNLHLLLKPEVLQTHEFKGSKLAVIDYEKCTQCYECEEDCRFKAIRECKIDPVLCEGCGVCAYLCSEEAIKLDVRTSGYAFTSKIKYGFTSKIKYGFMSHAKLNPGAENSGKLVALVRQNAKEIAEKEDCELILNDGPPGIGCPAISSIAGVDAGLIVVEPTLSGIHDMERAVSLLNHFQISPLVCVNKYDINRENTHEIVRFCASSGIEIAGAIPFDSIVTKSMVAGKPVVDYSPKSLISRDISELWNKVIKYLKCD